jgi:predicted Zn-dependent protease
VKYSEAEPLLLKLIQLEPVNVWALSSAAVAQFALGKFDAAIANGRRVHALPHKGYSVAHLVVANSLESSGRSRDAIDEYRQYLAEDPDGPNVAMARQSLARLSGSNARR